MEETAPWWMAGGLAAFWIVRETWGAVLSRKKERTETDANIDLLTGLVSRVKSLEEAQAAMTSQLHEEVRLRMTAEEEAHRLRLRVITLESAMRGIGAVIPEDPKR
ncbi:hypothetical protein ASD78_12235 [Lysobacter sp. Root667]|uniref:hypothetical protein n=1 Tax=Lysobacter sp. Root667 TaxID=1736581 RepID=UPI0006FFD1A7|nr:hypothetical protein [Lysobacter sp. Root667]KRA74255.1 hypothetical protein ASD78_12235 [Lysobacter sp. Root667]